MRTKLLLIFSVAVLVLLTVVAYSCSSDESNDDEQPVECNQDSKCTDGQVCSEDNVCKECTKCELQTDCDPGYLCDTTRGCCKKVNCKTDIDCDSRFYCIEFICRNKTCEKSEDCTREGHYCNDEKKCVTKQCTKNEDCLETNLCDTNTSTCIQCANDDQCKTGRNPDQSFICSVGVCKEVNTSADGDYIGDRKGCEAFQDSCLYETLKCFDKIYPPENFDQCLTGKDDKGQPVQYSFFFNDDGAVWRQYLSPRSYEAATNKGFCYKLVPGGTATVWHLEYFDENQKLIGTYDYDMDTNTLTIECPEKDKEYYNLNEMSSSCDGFPGKGIYEPPAPGIRDCSE